MRRAAWLLAALVGCGGTDPITVGLDEAGAAGAQGQAGGGDGGSGDAGAPATDGHGGGNVGPGAGGSAGTAGAAGSAGAPEGGSGPGAGGSGGDPACFETPHQQACDAVGWCGMTPDGCGGMWECGGSTYLVPQGKAWCPLPNVTLGGCPQVASQCEDLGIYSSDAGWLQCCSPEAGAGL